METWASWGSGVFTSMTHSAQFWLVLCVLLLWWGYDKFKHDKVARASDEMVTRAPEPLAAAKQTEVHLPQRGRSFWGRKSLTRKAGLGNWIAAVALAAGMAWAYDAGFGQDMRHILAWIGIWQVMSWIVG